MEAQALLPHRAALIGAAVALTIGLAGGLALKTGSQTAPETEAAYVDGGQHAEVEQIAWPSGKPPDYVIGTDFLEAQHSAPPPVVVASYEVPDYTPATWEEPASTPPPAATQPMRPAPIEDRAWPSTQGDILDTRLPEDAPRAPAAPVAVAAPVARTAAAY